MDIEKIPQEVIDLAGKLIDEEILKRLTERKKKMEWLKCEVEKAWNEGFLSGRNRGSFGQEDWNQSRAKRISEGATE